MKINKIITHQLLTINNFKFKEDTKISVVFKIEK